MEAIEITVYIGIALIVTGLFIGLLFTWKADRTVDDIRSLILRENGPGVPRVSTDGLIKMMHETWLDCGMGEGNATSTVYVEADALAVAGEAPSTIGQLSKDEVFDRLRQLNYCRTLQSSSNSCGTREDVEMNQIELPGLVLLSCDQENKRLEVVQ